MLSPRLLASLYRANSLSRANPATISRWQERRLRKLLRHAVAKSPLYAERFKGIDVSRCGLADLPTLTKAEAMPRFEDWVIDRDLKYDEIDAFIDDERNVGKLYRDKYVLLHTSGSQGRPTIVVQTPRNIELTFVLQATRGNATGQSGPREIVRRFFSPARLAVVTLKYGFYPTAVNFDFFPRALGSFLKLRRWSQTDENLLDELNDYSPTVVSGYTNVLLSLAEEANAGKLRLPHLTHLVNYSEELTEAARELLTETFHVPIMNMYATGECGHLTSGCPTDPGCHVNADWAILEVVDEQGRPVEPGTRGAKVYITNLANYVQPLIRYEVTDRVTMAAEPCGCGSTMPRIESIDGRKTDCLWLQRGSDWKRLDVTILKHAVDFCGEILEWQAKQDVPEKIVLHVAPVPGHTINVQRLERAMEREWSQYGLTGLAQVEVKVVPRLAPDEKTGKVKRVLCRVGPDQPTKRAA